MLYQTVNPGKQIPIGRAVKRTPSEKVESVSVCWMKEIHFGSGDRKGKRRGSLPGVWAGAVRAAFTEKPHRAAARCG